MRAVDNRAGFPQFPFVWLDSLSFSSFLPSLFAPRALNTDPRQDGEQVLQELSSLHTHLCGLHGLIALRYHTPPHIKCDQTATNTVH
jgi:hypothetical protein